MLIIVGHSAIRATWQYHVRSSAGKTGLLMSPEIDLLLALALVFTLVGLVIVLLRLTRQPSVRALEVDVMRLAATRAVGVSLAARLELDALLDLIVRQSIGLVGAAGGAVYLFEPDHTIARIAAAHGFPSSYTQEAITSLGIDLAAQVKTLGHTLNASMGTIGGSFAPVPYATAAVPLKFANELVGIVAVFEWAAGRTYAEADVAALELLAPQAAIAIMNARSFQALKTTQQALTAQVEELTMLERVDQELNATLNLESVL